MDATEAAKVRVVTERPPGDELAVATTWRLPSDHGDLYYYQKLMLNTPWRDPTPSAFVDPVLNPRGSLKEQCRLTVRRDGSPIMPHGDEAEVARAEAEARLFTPEQARARPAPRAAPHRPPLASRPPRRPTPRARRWSRSCAARRSTAR